MYETSDRAAGPQTVETEINGKPGLLNLEAGRRAFLRNIGLGMTAAAVFGGASAMPDLSEAAAPSDADILNFALNLEYLEAEFYLRAAFGRGLGKMDTTGSGRLGRVFGGRAVNFPRKSLVREYAREIAVDEEAHVKFLRAGLGGARVARPAINIDKAFRDAANAAGLGTNFDAYANENNFSLAAFIFEDVGVTAYKGAARFLQNKDFLEAAAGILAVEAYHAATIRSLLYARGFVNEAGAISDLRDSVDGSGNRDQGIWKAGGANIVPADPNGIAYSRSARQVLNIVYLGNQEEGGFFPNGLNGSIK